MHKVVVVGPGLMGKQHIELLSQIDYVSLMGLVAPLSDKNRTYASSLSVPLFSDLPTCFKQLQPDGVIIASPNEFHADQASICVNHGIPFLLEKPMTIEQEEARKLWELVKANKFMDKVMVGHHRSHGSIIKKALEVIRSGVLGKLVTVQGSAQFYKPASYFAQGPWRSQPGGGPILLNMIHEISNFRALLGEIETVQVIASSATRQSAVEDTAVFNFSFQSGALGSFVLSDCAASSKSWEMTSGENPSYPHHPDEYCYVVSGTQGMLEIPTMQLKFYSADKQRSWMTPFETSVVALEKVDPLACQISEFAEMIKGNAVPTVTVFDGYRNLAVVEAMKKAALSGSMETVEY